MSCTLERLTRVALSVSLLALTTSCLQFRLRRIETGTEIPEEAYAGLAPTRATLEDALESLGAPVFVRELPSDGLACAWGWQGGRTFGATLQLPVTDSAGVSLDYDQGSRDLDGVVLFFDRDLILMSIERGRLRSLLPESPPARLVAAEEGMAAPVKSEDAADR